MRHAIYRRLMGGATAVAAAWGLAVVATTPAWAVAPANDNFANAQAQTGSFTDSVNTADATGESGEPDVCYAPTSNSVWYALTPASSGTVTIDTIGSNYDTSLEVYTGSSLTGLTLLTCDDDSGGNFAASVTFSVTASTTYSIRAVDWNGGGTGGNLVVNGTPICTITGTQGADTLTGTSGNDVICGLGGNDTIDGGNGSDTIWAGDGDDAVGGGNGADTIYGQGGNDDNDGETLLGGLLHLFDNGSDTIDGGPGNDTLDGQNGDDTLVDENGTDNLSGSLGNDTIDVEDGVGGDTANGGLGSDTCAADGGDSTSGC